MGDSVLVPLVERRDVFEGLVCFGIRLNKWFSRLGDSWEYESTWSRSARTATAEAARTSTAEATGEWI